MTRKYIYRDKIDLAVIPSCYIALDLETTGLNPRKDRIVGIAFTIEGGKGFYTPDVAGLMAVVNKSKLQPIFHNAVFDVSFLKKAGFSLSGRIHDTMLLSHVINPERPSYGLKELSREILGVGATDKAQAMTEWLLANGLTKADIYKAPKEVLTAYAAEDVINTYELFIALCKKIKYQKDVLGRLAITGDPWNYYLKECADLIPVIVDMEMDGVKLDVEKTVVKQKELEDRSTDIFTRLTDINKDAVNSVEEKLYNRKIQERMKKNKTGRIKKMPPRVPFNWDSNDHLKILFLNHYKFPIAKKTKKGNASVDSSFIETLKTKLPWVEDLLILKEYRKLTSTYLNKLLLVQEGGFIHANFNLSGTTTGRFSSSNPNLQNLPKHGEIKSLFVPRAGNKFIYADYSQLELRVAAHLSQDKRLIDAYTTGVDLHQETADIINTTRDKGKTINFAIIYNASGWRIAEIMGWMDDIPLCTSNQMFCECSSCKKRFVQAEKGAQLIEKLFGHYRGLKKYLDSQKKFMLKYGISISNFGRMRKLSDINSPIRRKANHALKAGFNLPIQSFGASICKRSMLSLYNQGFRIVNQIHDSVIVECPEGVAEAVAVQVKDVMEHIYPLTVPLVVEPKIRMSFEEK